ncbi:piwi-like protein 1 [Acanthaster planci]|uniref:Piwi-like protein 1 n=1 Tax=Acanthaster planci TaxID=133434 RepID=A0A8B7ZWQ5_ACAPL|nr:piwi-like protein 1 [Acanthaster planci]XP_022109193.1 piwi-like protein 1 [Acanthaster planci]XP_022109194.1 piwi-like protein 1 [Acanthaster planci]XP_022109195.1 piwi-like protein 1 [Acanthaster planci]
MADNQQASGSGRARGRGRGRGRASQQHVQPRRPGEPAGAATAMPKPLGDPDTVPAPGRGRSRGGASQIPGSGAAISSEQKAGATVPLAEPPTTQMAALSMGQVQGAEGGGVSARRGGFLEEELKTRPEHLTDKRGKKGKTVELLTNCFRLRADGQWLLYQYDVKFSPEVDSRRARHALLRSHSEIVDGPMAFDGMILFLLRRLDQPVTRFETKRRDSDAVVTITITLTSELPPNSPTYLQVYNIIFRKILRLVGFEQIGRNYFNPELKIDIQQHKLQLWPGFITSILQYEEEVLLMADVSHKILRTETVLDLIYHLSQTKEDWADKFKTLITGEIVLTKYNNKTYRVDDVVFDKNPLDAFEKFDGTTITYAEYYRDAYEVELRDFKQPLLVGKRKKRDERQGATNIHLIPELCTITGLSDNMRSDFHVMRDLATITRITPNDRLQQLSSFLGSFPKNKEAYSHLRRWQLNFDPQPVRINARIMDRETIITGDRGSTRITLDENAEWSRQMRKELLNSVGLLDWMLIYIGRDSKNAMDFLTSLNRVAPNLGMEVRTPLKCELRDDRTESFIRAIRDNLTPRTQMVVCILPTSRKDRYDAIKKLCCLEAPVPSQCIVSRTISKKQTIMSVATKIAMQVNCKMGGELWTVEIPSKMLMMVVGIDSYHDLKNKEQSVGGFVASMNHSLTRYYSRCTFQHSGQELIDSLKVCMTSALKNFHEINGSLPERVIIYRDGVGDGQLAAVVNYELPQLLSTFQMIGKNYKPKGAMVVVKKRINNRFFSLKGGQLQNPSPGTVIDSGVTKPEFYDFFLVSQSVRQGTVTPTSYNVIWDVSGLAPDHIQSLTYKLTHLYFNWPGTIRVPAPCLYAHKLAFLVGQSLHREPRIELADRLFFL